MRQFIVDTVVKLGNLVTLVSIVTALSVETVDTIVKLGMVVTEVTIVTALTFEKVYSIYSSKIGKFSENSYNSDSTDS